MTPTPEYCLFFIDSWMTCLDRSEWASWVQAVGSIGAIIVTVLAVNHAHRLQQRQKEIERQQDYKAFLTAVADLITGVAATAQRIFQEDSHGRYRTPLEFEALNIELEGLCSALQRIDITRFHQLQHLTSVCIAENQTRFLLAVVKRVTDPATSPMLEGPLLQNSANMAFRRLKELSEQLYVDIKQL